MPQVSNLWSCGGTLLLSHVCICIKIKGLRKGELILPLYCCCCYWLLRSKLLGYGGPTPSRRRRLGS